MKSKLNVWGIGWVPWRTPYNWWCNIKNFFRCLQRSWQRATKGYCDYDVWDLDEYLCYMTRDTLRRLSEITHGAPDTMIDHEKDSIKPWKDLLNDTADRIDCVLSDRDPEVDKAWEKYEYATQHKEKFNSQQIDSLRSEWVEKNLAFDKKRQCQYEKILDFFCEWHWDLWD